MDVRKLVNEIAATMQSKAGLKSIYFVGCGGSQAALYPGVYFLRSEARGLIVDLYSSNEFVHNPPKNLDNSSIVVCCSLKGTAETVAAAKLSHATGAVTIAMTGSPDTPMAEAGQYTLTYSSGDEDEQNYSASNQATALRLAMEILNRFAGYDHYEVAMSLFPKLNEVFSTTKSSLEPLARQFTDEFSDDEVFYVLGSGPLYYTAYSMACCHLMEMQWKHAVFLHSGEYFHGPFETTEATTAIILFKSAGRTRALDERVEHFLKKHSQHYLVLDADKTGLRELAPEVAEYFEPIIMTPIERHFVYEMSLKRGHCMDKRRYMWKEHY